MWHHTTYYWSAVVSLPIALSGTIFEIFDFKQYIGMWLRLI